MGAESTELGNLATVKADASPVVSEPESPVDTQSKRDYVDNDQLARMGKKQVLRVRFHDTRKAQSAAFNGALALPCATMTIS